MKVNIGISARHVHLTHDDFKYLFGDVELTVFKELSQPGQFASNEKVNIITDKGRIDGLRILGPFRNYTQVEISKTDSFKLGINPPVRNSGDLDNSERVIIEYNGKELVKDNCCIIATRHIHIGYDDLEKYNLKNGQLVSLKVSGEKGGTLDNVYIKAGDVSFIECHLDVDDGNAHLLKTGDTGEVIYE